MHFKKKTNETITLKTHKQSAVVDVNVNKKSFTLNNLNIQQFRIINKS